MWFGLLPNRIVIFRFNPTPLWIYARRVLGLVAVVSGGLWLTLDIWLLARMTDGAGLGDGRGGGSYGCRTHRRALR
jgi:hypothetical protein